MLRLFMPFDFCDQTVLFICSLMHGNPLWYVVRGHAMLAVDGADEFWEEECEDGMRLAIGRRKWQSARQKRAACLVFGRLGGWRILYRDQNVSPFFARDIASFIMQVLLLFIETVRL